MLGRRLPRTTSLAWGLCAFALVLAIAGVPFQLANGGPPVQAILALLFIVPFALTGGLLASRRPGNAIGWLFCAMSSLFALTLLAQGYATLGLVTHRGSLPAAVFVAWLEQWPLWLVFPAGIAELLILFPNGRPQSRRWWPVLGLCVACSVAMVVGSMFGKGELTDALRPASGPGVDFGVKNPVGIQALRGTLLGVGSIAGRLGSFLLVFVSAGGLIFRTIRARGDERQQLKWVAYVGAIIVVGIVGAIVGRVGWIQDLSFTGLVIGGLFIGLPAATAIAVLRYRLYDIDIVISKSLVYGALAVFIGAVYVAIVVGLGSLVGTRGQPNIALSIVATAVVAVAFQPIRERLQKFANRLVYGHRASPYEVLMQFSEQVAGTYASEDVLPRMARVLTEGTGAARASVWIRIGDQLRPAAVWPETMTPDGDGDRRVVVRHQGETLGELRLSKPTSEPLSPVEEKLLQDLAAQAGLVLRNVRLTTELHARLKDISDHAAELRASRQRIVAAQDAERSRLERNIHDGAQQNLVALTVKLRLASTLVKRNPERVRSILAELKSEAGTARATLADLARGIYPQQLLEGGLVEALKPHARVEAHDISRYDPEIETAVYFACMEALQNAAKHARASNVEVQLAEKNGSLTFAVNDDGVGFERATAVHGAGLQNMRDRIDALGGQLNITAIPGKGTTVTGRIPVRLLEPVP